MKQKPARKFVLALLLGGSFISIALSQTNDDLTPQAIVQKSLDAYAALNGYSDTGEMIESNNAGQVTITPFSLKLQRPNFFKVDWLQPTATGAKKGTWYSDTDTNFGEDQSYLLDTAESDTNSQPQIIGIPFALSQIGANSGYAIFIPEIFLRFETKDLFESIASGDSPEQWKSTSADDCYEIFNESKGTNAISLNLHPPDEIVQFWIGKRDYLLRKFQLTLMYRTGGKAVEIQTHENISLNPKFSPDDFTVKLSPRTSNSIILHSSPPSVAHPPDNRN